MGGFMKAELIINYGRDEDDIFHTLFGSDTDKFYTIELLVEGESVSSIIESSMDSIHEILNIDHSTESFIVDRNRLLTILAKYHQHHRFIDLKKLLRPIINKDITDIKIIKS